MVRKHVDHLRCGPAVDHYVGLEPAARLMPCGVGEPAAFAASDDLVVDVVAFDICPHVGNRSRVPRRHACRNANFTVILLAVIASTPAARVAKCEARRPLLVGRSWILVHQPIVRLATVRTADLSPVGAPITGCVRARIGTRRMTSGLPIG